MLRERVIETVRTVVEQQGYAFCSGFKYRINTTLNNMPTAWLEPPSIAQIVGREQGRVRYKIVIHLIELARDVTQERKEELWAAMDGSTMNIAKALALSENIVEVVSVHSAPLEYNLTNQGEISCRIEAQIDMLYDKTE